MSQIFAIAGFSGILFGVLLLTLTFATLLRKGRGRGVLFSFITGSVIALVLVSFAHAMADPKIQGNAFLIALAIVVIVLLWKFLFGPWDSLVKAEVLGTFVFWIAVEILKAQTMEGRLATLLAAFVAAIPAAIWCLLFLRYHFKRLSVVLLTFLAGMLSTAPILFYDSVVRRGVEMHFFLFKITPASFMQSSKSFVTQSLTGEAGIISASVAVTVVSFALVGVIEEWSKHWVTKKSDPAYFTSVNDVMQLSIIAAIGFAFAENIVNPNYFIAFVTNYLVEPPSPQWAPFIGSVFGRSIITNMVHITSSGVLGYFYGLAFFAKPALEEDRAKGKKHHIVLLLHRLTGVSRIELYKEMMMLSGLLWSIGLHSFFDIAVSLPETMPGNPHTVGELLGYTGPLSGVSLILAPALLYVFGGFALLTHLFHRKEDLKEFGYRLKQEVFVSPAAA